MTDVIYDGASIDSGVLLPRAGGNLYATVQQYQDATHDTGAAEADVLLILDAASREAEYWSGRKFYSETGTRYFRGGSAIIPIDDLLSVSEVAVDTSGDLSWGSVLVEDTDYRLWPRADWPKAQLRDITGYLYSRGYESIRVTGTWGAGDLAQSDPWTAGTATVSMSASDTSVLLDGQWSAGATLRVDSEQVYLQSATYDATTGYTTVRVLRGVNGTTAAAHTGATVYAAVYPPDVIKGVLWLAAQLSREVAAAGLESERIGDYSYKILTGQGSMEVRRRIFGRCRREVV